MSSSSPPVLDVLNIRNERGPAVVPAPATNGAGDGPPSPNGVDGKGRAPNGRFAKGNKGGPGNPFGRKTAALRSALLDAVTPAALKRIVKKLIQRSEAGNLDACKLLLAYTIGKPTEAADPDDVPRAEWERLGSVERPQVFRRLLDGIDPWHVLDAAAALLGYASGAEFRAALFASRDPVLASQLSASLAEQRAPLTLASADPASESTWKLRLGHLLITMEHQKDALPAETAMEAAGVVQSLLARLAGMGLTFQTDLPHMGSRLRHLVERARPAARTPEAVALLDALEKEAKAGEAVPREEE